MPSQRREFLNVSISTAAFSVGPSLFETKKTCKIKSLHAFPQVRRGALDSEPKRLNGRGGLPLGRHPLALGVQLVQRREVRLGRGNDDVWIAANAVDHPAAMLQPNSDLAL